jgi:hypothetical protein
MQHHNKRRILQKLYSQVVASNIEKKNFFDELIGHTAECNLNVPCSGTMCSLGIQRNVSICKVKTVMGNPNVLRTLYKELMLIGFYCPCQVSSVDIILENKIVLLCYSKKFIWTPSNHPLAILSD